MNKYVFEFLTVTLLSGCFFLVSSCTYADNDIVVDEVNVTIPISCTLSGTGMDSHVTELQNTESNSAIGETIMKAYCNDNNGFSIYAIGFTDDEYGKTVLTDSSIDSTNDIITGTSTSGPTSNWAMKLSTVTNPTPTYPITIQDSFDSFHNIPNEYTKVAERTSGTDIGINAEGSTLKSTYQAYISPTQSAGTYVGQVKYTLVHPYDTNAPINYAEPIECPAGYVCYSPAANDAMGTMNVQSVGSYAGDTTSVIGYQVAESNDTIRLTAPNFKRNNYGFVGWGTSLNSTETVYGPNQTISTSDLSESGLALYAKWISSSSDMQNWAGCSALATNQVIGLKDNRDQNVYAVTKLADGNCWMMENLRLENPTAINAQNTNNPAQDFVIASSSTDDWCYDYYNSSCTGQSLVNTNNTNIGGTNSSMIDLIPSSGGDEDSEGYDGTTFQWYSYGNYYNWYYATAGNGVYSFDNGSTTGDICPVGWALPTGDDYGDIETLNNAINSGREDTDVGLRQYPANFVLNGLWYYDEAEARGFGGGCWSRTTINDSEVHTLSFFERGVDPGYYGDHKAFGYPIRCMLEP